MQGHYQLLQLDQTHPASGLAALTVLSFVWFGRWGEKGVANCILGYWRTFIMRRIAPSVWCRSHRSLIRLVVELLAFRNLFL